MSVKLIKTLSLSLLVSGLLACVQHASQSETLCVFPNKQVAPEWVCGKPVAGAAIQAVGVVDKSVAGPNYMYDMARIAAVKHLTQAFKEYAAKSVIQYLTAIEAQQDDAIQAGASSIKSISIATLANAEQYRYEIGPEGRAYMLLGLNRNSRSALLESTLKTSMQNDQALWLKFKTQKSFAELASDIAAQDEE